MNILAIIPARGGSKGIPKKNIVQFGGRPLIAWTIQAALTSGVFSRVIVSTDSEEIADVAREWGAEVPFMRPDDLSGDLAPAIAADLHAVKWMADHDGFETDYLAHLQPTSPFRTSQHIEEAFDIAFENSADAVVSVVQAKQNPYWMKTILPDGRIENYIQGSNYNRRQDLPTVYALNGAIYIARPTILRDHNTWYVENSYGYEMSELHSVDIDEPLDLEIARVIYERYFNEAA